MRVNSKDSNAGMVASSFKNDGRPVKSKALAFHLHLSEVFDNHPEPLSRERIRVVFDILDALVVEVGSYSSVLSIVKNELKKAVYSPGITSNSLEPFYESVPFCLMIDRMQKIRAKEITESNKEIEDLKQKIKFRNEDLDVLYRKNIQLKQNLADAQSNYVKAHEELNKFASEKDNILAEKLALENQYLQMEERYQKDLSDLQAVNTQANAALEMLTVFQTPSSDGQEKLSSQQEAQKKTDIEVTGPGLLKYDIEQGNQIENRFSDMLDYLLEEFEGNLSQIFRRKEIKYGAAAEDPEVMEMFCKNISETIAYNQPRLDKYLKELANLQTHGQALRLQEIRNASNIKLPTIDPIDLTARKYALILQTSVDGEKFYTHENSVYCTRCGDRVISCPHIFLDSKPLPIPSKSTHFKLNRPILKLRSQILGSKQEVQTEDEDENISPIFFRIWKNYYDKRGGSKPNKKRPLSSNKILAIAQEFYETKWRWDRDASKDEDAESLQDSFYKFLQERYIYKEIYLKVAYDIFSTLQQANSVNDHISLFVIQLSGEQEEYWKYMQLARKLVYSGPSNELLDRKKYRAKIRAMYPDREVDVYDQIELEYSSFCKNKLSNESMLDQIAHMIMKKTEPNFQLIAKLADQYDPQQYGYLSFNNFSEFCLKLVPTAPAIEIEKRYKLAEKYYGHDEVKMDRIIAMGAYIVLFTSFASGWMTSGLVSTHLIL